MSEETVEEIVVKIPIEAIEKAVAEILSRELRDYMFRNWTIQAIRAQVKEAVRKYFKENVEAEVIELLKKRESDIKAELPSIVKGAIKKSLETYAKHVAAPMLKKLRPTVRARVKKLVEKDA